MAKRQRGSPPRPGQRTQITRATVRPATPAAAPRPATLTEAEEERAAALEATVVADEKAAANALARGRERRRAIATGALDVQRTRTRSGGALATAAAQEYEVVHRDLRRIVTVFALIFALLVISFIAVQAFGIAAPPAAS